MNKLENYILESITDTLVYCKYCKISSSRANKTPGKRLIIDTEYYFSDDFFKSMKISGKFQKINFNEIPCNIRVNNGRYILNGIIAYVKPLKNTETGHCVLLTKVWNMGRI